MTILDTIERVVPRMRLYPPWAKALFAVTFAMILTSFFLWVLLAPKATATEKHKSVNVDIGVGATSTEASSGLNSPTPPPYGTPSGRTISLRSVAAKTEAALEAPIVYELIGRTIQPKVPYLRLVRHGGPLGGIDEFDWWDAAETSNRCPSSTPADVPLRGSSRSSTRAGAAWRIGRSATTSRLGRAMRASARRGHSWRSCQTAAPSTSRTASADGTCLGTAWQRSGGCWPTAGAIPEGRFAGTASRS
jgi:hypothetical protein